MKEAELGRRGSETADTIGTSANLIRSSRASEVSRFQVREPGLCNSHQPLTMYKSSHCGLAQWLTPVIPILWEAEVGRSQGQEFKTSLTKMLKHGETPLSTKIRQSWWHVPVVPATQEAELGGSLEPMSLRLK